MPPNLRIGLTCLFAAGVVLALVFALVLPAPTSKLTLLSIRGDHLMHAATFSLLTFIGAWLWSPAGVLAALMVGAGGVLELIQAPVGREMGLDDWVAGNIGVAIGFVIFGLITTTITGRQEY